MIGKIVVVCLQRRASARHVLVPGKWSNASKCRPEGRRYKCTAARNFTALYRGERMVAHGGQRAFNRPEILLCRG